ncbi:hypothetical protein [Paenibacillus sanfengchensis]
MENSPRYVCKSARESLIEKLGLPEPDEFCQDWEYVVANSSRLEEFLAFYGKGSLNSEEKFALMVIIVSSFNDHLSEYDFDIVIWNRIRHLLEEDMQIHVNTILYWSLEGEDLEDCFPITRYMREIEISPSRD